MHVQPERNRILYKLKSQLDKKREQTIQLEEELEETSLKVTKCS